MDDPIQTNVLPNTTVFWGFTLFLKVQFPKTYTKIKIFGHTFDFFPQILKIIMNIIKTKKKKNHTKDILRNFLRLFDEEFGYKSKAKYIIIEFFKGDLHFQYFVQHINLASTSWKKERENDFSFTM